MRTIALEEHFVTESFLRATRAHGERIPPQLAELQSKLLDIGPGRIADMDKSGIDHQVLSLAAMGFDALDAETASSLARDINDELAEAAIGCTARSNSFAIFDQSGLGMVLIGMPGIEKRVDLPLFLNHS